MKRRIIILFLIFWAAAYLLRAQSAVFSQYYSAALYTNPAWSGFEGNTYLGMNYRSQWGNIDLPFNTFQFTFIHPLLAPGISEKHLGGIGASLFNDVTGPNQEFITSGLTVGGTYNIHFDKSGKNIVSFGLQGGCFQQRVNFDALQWSSQYTQGMGFDASVPGETQLNDQVIYPVFNAGVLWHTTSRQRFRLEKLSIYNGIAIYNINKPRSFYEGSRAGEMLLKVHGGLSHLLNTRIEISPNYLLQYQNQMMQINVGGYMSYSFSAMPVAIDARTRLTLGIWYRVRDSFIYSMGVIHSRWNFGASYDANVSSLRKYLGNGQAYEFSMGYRIMRQKGFKKFSSPLI